MQLALVAAFCLLAFAGFAGLGWQRILEGQRAAERIQTVLLPEITVLEEMHTGALEVISSTNEVILIRVIEVHLDHLGIDGEDREETEEEEEEQELQQVAAGREKFLAGMQHFTALAGEGPMSRQIQVRWNAVETASGAILAETATGIHIQRVDELREDLEDAEIAMMTLLSDLIDQTTAANFRNLEAATATVQESARFFTLVAAVGTLTLIGFALFTVRSLRRRESLLEDLQAETDKTAAALEDAEHARNEAIRLSQAKTEFLAMMSHEIRTPMNGVIGMLELMKDTDLTGEQEEFVRIIDGSAAALLTVINDILDLTRIQAGRVDLRPEPVEVKELVCSVASLVRATTKKKGIALSVDFDETAPRLAQLDPVRMRQVLTNIVGNAAKFTDAGSIDISVWSSHCKTLNGPALYIAVNDTGPGIEDEKLAEIFDAFTQSDSSLSRRHEGTGLGLSIAKGLIEAMGGFVSVTSRLEVGSTFTIGVPLIAVAPEADGEDSQTAASGGTGAASDALPAPAPASATAVAPTAPAGRVDVLAVDDNPTNLLVAEKLVESLGYTVATAAGGEEALQIARRTEFDLILMDLQMPEMDGFQTMEAIRRALAEAGEYRPMPPVVAMTAHASRIFAEESLERGMVEHLSKPLTKPALASCLERYLGAPAD